MTEQEIREILSSVKYNGESKNAVNIEKAFHNAIAVAASNQHEIDTNIKPQSHCSCCSDSRETTVDDAGMTSYHRTPGGFVIDPDGNLTVDSKLALEKSVQDKTPVFLVRQHSRCGAMGIIYAYHALKKGHDYVKDHYGNEFAILAKRRANLYSEVSKKLGVDQNNFSYYKEKFGVPLIGDDAAKFQTCMALQQGLWDFEALKEKSKNINNSPEILYCFKHVAEDGRIYAFNEKDMSFVALPFSTDKNSSKKMQDVLSNFKNQDIKDRIAVEWNTQESWRENNNFRKQYLNNDMSKVQAPVEACIRFSSPSADDSVDMMRKPGSALFERVEDGLITQPDGKIQTHVAQFQELARAYKKVHIIQIEQLSSSETIDKLFEFHSSIEGEKAVIARTGKSMGILRSYASIYSSVNKRVKTSDGGYDFSHYKKMGMIIEDGESVETTFKKCMSIQQGIWGYEALAKKHEEDPTLPPPQLFFRDVNTGRISVYCGKEKSFTTLPVIDNGLDIAAEETCSRPTKSSETLSKKCDL